MNLKFFISTFLVLIAFVDYSWGQTKVECWKRFELTFNYKAIGNPFDVELSAIFSCDGKELKVKGFYDGDDTYRIRFMPTEVGVWKYSVSSPIKELNKKSGLLTVIPNLSSNPGMVSVDGKHAFKYANGTHYYPLGTTSYAWLHMNEEVQEETLESLKHSGFNKIRMCVFPKNYDLVQEEPQLYPFEIKKMIINEKGDEVRVWNFKRFNPAYFRHLERCIDQLCELNIEVDLILFHPYDKGRWGFDSMTNEVNIRYIHYIINRLGSFCNVWWSIANEWDYVTNKTIDDWKLLTKTVVNNDPYRHLCSIHGSTATYFDYWMPEFTHVSVQDEAPVYSISAAALLRQIFHKPVICDEVGYEGNLKSRWGRLSAQQLTYFIVNGLMGGIYVTHGECFQEENEPIFWAQGGKLKGESWKRVKFLKAILEEMPGPLQMSDISRDLVTSTAGEGYYFISLGKEIRDFWRFNLPVKNVNYEILKAGKYFRVDIIDVWNMTITKCPTIFETGEAVDYRVLDKKQRGVRLPDAPYLLLRVTEVKRGNGKISQ